jgi:DNA-binding CsgD family transcriptional regulator
VESDLIDQIYEAAFLPERWPTVLDRLARMIDAEGGWFMALSPDRQRFTGSEVFVGGLTKFVDNGWLPRTDRVRRGIRAAHPGFLTEADLYPDGDMATDPFYRRFLWKVGLGWGAGTVIAAPTFDTMLLSFERKQERGPVESEHVGHLDALRPHLARSALMAARLRMERAQAVSQTLALIGLPALVFDARGKVIAANALIEMQTEHLSWRAGGRVSLKDRHADVQFEQAITLLGRDAKASVRSFAVRDTLHIPCRVAHVVPIRGNARDIFDRCLGVLMLTPVAVTNAPPVELVQSLFDLTAAEAKVARSLALGDSLDEIAVSGSVSRNTVRTHVRRVLEKTGCHRQAEVVAMLSGITVPRSS